MESQQQRQQDQDLLADPNLLMAVAMVKSITNLMDKGGLPNEDIKAHQTYEENFLARVMKSPAQILEAPKIEAIEVAPVQELVEKLRSKTLLSRDEVNAITQCLTMHFCDDVKKFLSSPAQATRLREVLWLAYYVILNAHAYGQGNNYLDQQALQKLIKQVLSLIKSVLEVVNKKDQALSDAPGASAHLFNSLLPPALKVIALFQTPAVNDQQHYKYLRASNLKLETLSLGFLNQVLTEILPHIYGKTRGQKQKPIAVKVEEVIQLIGTGVPKLNPNLTDDEFMMSMLEYVPPDYEATTQSLQQQQLAIKVEVDDESMSMDEESKQPIETVGQVCKDHIHKLKLIEQLSKAVDRMVTMANSEKAEDFFLILDSNLFSLITKNIEVIAGLKPKLISSFLQKSLTEKTIKAQNMIIDHFGNLEDIDRIMTMEIDQIMEQPAQGSDIELKSLQDNVSILAKSLEITIQTKDSQLIIELIKQSQNMKYLSQLIKIDRKKPQMTQMIQSITQTLCNHLRNHSAPEISHNESVDLMVLATRLVLVSRALNDMKSTKDKKKNEEEKQPQSIFAQAQPVLQSELNKSSLPNIRTRGQMKKEQTTSTSKDHGKKESTNSQTKIVEVVPQMTIVQVDASDLLKNAMNLLTKVMPLYFKNSSQLTLSSPLLRNLYALASNTNPQISRLVYGILSEFTRPGHSYLEDSIILIREYVLKKLSKITSSHTKTVLTIKLMFLTANQKNDETLALMVATQLVQGKLWISKKGIPAKSVSEMYSSKNLDQYLLYISCLLIMSKSREQCGQLTDSLMKELSGEQLVSNLHLLQLSLLNQQTLGLFKSSIHNFLTQLYSDTDSEVQMMSLISDVDKFVMKISNAQEQIYDPQLLHRIEGSIGIEPMIDRLQAQAADKSASDLKALINVVIKQVVKINSEIRPLENINLGAIDIESYIGMQMSLGLSNLGLMHSRFELSSNTQTQEIYQKLSSKIGLTNDDVEIINVLHRSIKYLAELVEKASIQCLKEQCDANEGSQTNSDGIALILRESTKGQAPNQKLCRLQQLTLGLSLSSNSKAHDMIQLIIEPQQLAKHIALVRAHSFRLEEVIYSHCFSIVSEISGFQLFTSQCMLLKQLFQNMTQILNVCTDSKEEFIQEVSLNLLMIKYDNPFIEYMETGSHNFDFDQSEKIMNKALSTYVIPTGTLTNRDFIKMRNLDSALHCIFIAQSVIKASKSQQMQAVVNEIAQSFVQFSNYKQPTDINLISAMFNSFKSPLSQFFSQVMKCGQTTKDIYSQIWTQAFQYLQILTFESDVDLLQLSQVSKENKGGIQMVINFAPDNKRGKPRANKAMALGSRKAPVEQELIMQLDQPADAEVQQKVINVTAQKLLIFLGDVTSIDKNSSKEHEILSQVFRQAFLRSDDDLTFIQLLHETKQVQLLKKIVSALLHQDQTETPETLLRTQIQQKLYKSLVNFIKRQGGVDSLDDEKSAIMVSIELAQIMTDNNKQLIQFISEQILQSASRLIGDASSTKLIILDLLCQLAQTKFSVVDKDQVAKYNTETILERRKLQQVVRRRKDEDKQRQIEQSQIESQNVDGEDTVMVAQGESAQTQDGQGVEGFKQEKFEKESDYQKYMERHEEVCTFTSTKKEFTTQHWYFCYTCRLTDNSGCCSVCAHKCHKGHQVVYSKKSNFFCDCGDSGNCQCLNPGNRPMNPFEGNKRPPSQKRRIRDDHMPDKGLHPLGGGMFGQQMLAGGYGPPPRQIVPPQRNQPIQFMNPYERNLIMQQQEDENAMMLQQLGSYIDPNQLPQDFMRSIGGPGGMRFLDENSEEDQNLGDFIPQALLQHHENRMVINDDDDSDEDMDRHMRDHQQQNIKKIMKQIKNVPKNAHLYNPLGQAPIFGGSRIEQIKIKKPVSPLSLSQVSSVNPLEDPFSDAGAQTPVLHQNFMMDMKDTIENFSHQIVSQEDDASMSYSMEVLQLSQELIEYLKNEQRHFDGVFNHLLMLIDEGSVQSQQMQIVDHPSIKKENSSQNNLLLTPKQSVVLTQDLTQNKKIFRESTFAIKVQNDSKNAVQQNINLLDVMDVNKDGLVAVCEDQEITFYAGSQFFDEQGQNGHDSEQFSFQSKEGASINKIESQKLGFQPLQVQFNPAQPQYCAAVGSQNVEVIVLTKQGKIAYKIVVELLLEAISKDITIVNVNWLPGSQSSLAIVTRDFIKIYDLAYDTISPIYNIMIFNGFITDITFSQHTVNPNDSSRAETTIYVASNIGNVYYQDINYKLNSFQTRTEEEKMQCDSDNSDLMLTETLVFDAKHNIKENTTKCLSVYSTQGNLNLLFISFSNGVTLVGKRVKDNGQFEDFKLNVQEDPSFNGSNLKAIWQRFGESIVNFKEIGSNSSGGEYKLYVTAYSRRQGSNFNQSGIPLLIEISENKVTVNVVKNSIMGSSSQSIIPVIGQAYIKNSHKSSQSMRLVNIMIDGSAATYTCKSLNDQLDEVAKPKSNESGVKNGNIESMINRSDLPKEVKLTVNFFEKQKNLFNDANLRAKLNFTGDIVTYFKNAKLVFESLSKITQNQVVISEAVKKSIKFQMKLDQNSEFLITGIRLRIDFSVARQPQNYLSLKLFNRVFKCKNYNNGPSQHPLWFEIPFCDAEVLYGSCSANNMQLELITDDPKIFPIRIAAMEVYGMSKKDFGYKDKVRRLEKLGSDKISKSPLTAQTSEMARVDDSIKEELLKTRGIPLVSWKERVIYLKDQIDQKQLDVIQTLDVITQYIGITNKIDNQMFSNLVQKLKGVLSKSIIDNSSQGFVPASVKRCLRKILSVLKPDAILGDPMNYKTVKDQIMVQVINNRLNNSDLTLKEVRSFIVSLLNIYNKRPYQIFKIIESHQDLIQLLTKQFINLNRPRADNKEVVHDIKGLFDLIIACYQQKINQNDCQLLTESQSIEAAINRVYSEDILVGFFEIIQPFILNEDDSIQRISFSVILNLVSQYSRSMGKSLKFNKLPQVIYSCDGAGQLQQKKLNILIVDFTPHLLKFVFTLVNKAQTLSSQGDVTYSLAYKLAYSFDQNCKELYGGKFNDQLVLTISTFIKNILVQPLTLSPENSSGSTTDKFLYANLVLCNIFMMQAMKDTKMRIKGSKLGLESQTQKSIIEMLQTDNDSTIKIIHWTQKILQTYEQAFKNQKCSMRIKMDEGMPGDVYEVIAGKNNGARSLLRPISETSSWKWHPLFVHTDQQFELLDRKIPAQILLNIQFVLGHFNSLEKLESATALPMKLVMAIREFALKKPAKSFLKVIGEQSIKQILQAINKSSTDQQQKVESLLQIQIKGSVAFEEFYEIYEVLYSKNLAKRALSFNLQFQLHSFLQKTWKKASEHPESWTYFISEQTPSRLNLLTQLFESAFLLNEDSAQLCLQLISLVFDHSVLFSFRQNETISISIFSVFQRNIEKQASVIPIKKNLQHLDLVKLIEVMLLGRNKKQLRLGAAHFLKGLYDKVEGMQSTIRDIMIEKIPQLRTQGVNSIEFIALLSYITNRDIQTRGVTEQLYSRLTSQIYKEVLRSNQQLTAHENLELYAALQKMTNAFATNSAEISLGTEEETLKKLLMIEKEASILFGARSQDGSSRNSKITNPYLLESEACQRCYAQKSLPFTQHKLNDVKAEAKFTDSTMVYRFTSTYMIKQIQITQDGFKGNKVINEVNVYINNKQGVDLADMKNNWNHWKKVKTQEVSPGQKQITIDFTLPVTASNLLLEYHTANNGKINQKDKSGDRARHLKPKKEACKIESINEVKGIDQVLRALPKRIAQKLGIVQSADGSDSPNKDENGAVVDKDQMACPRCGKVVQGKHGVCNSCGENALQCNFCRNINYEKPDGFLCNECGMSRFAKLDIGFTVKQGLAAERIETEEAKTQALGQIEQNLIASQNAYSQLMKKRTMIASLTKRINEGGSECGKIVTDMYTEECADLYMKMMKSLSSIKILKYEIDQYTQGGSSKGPASAQDLEEAPSLTRSHSTLSNDEDYAQESCFSCIQEYLKGLLSFIQVTSEKLATQYKSQGFIDLLYKQNIKMYTSALQDPARKAICSLLATDESQTVTLLQQIQEDLFKKKQIIPTHLLAANINQETYLVLDFLKQQTSLDKSFYNTVLDYMWQILFKALNEGSKNAAIADQIGGSFISYIKDVIKSQQAESVVKTNMTTLLLSMFNNKQQESTTFTVSLKENLKGKNFLLFALTIGSSQKLREEAKEIISHLYSQGDEFLHIELLKQLLSILDRVLEQASAGDQYFDILTQILNPATIKEKITSDSLRKESHNHIYVEAFDLLFKQIDRELNKLVKQENQRLALGADGFMPQISMGQTFARVVSLVSSMIKESPHLKGIIQNNVSIVIKSFLKVKKLNLTKNKVIQTSEVEIEKMFKELHSQREEDKQNFILECIKIIESGECDYQEMRFLFEEMCKVIDPAKPEPEYLLNLNRPQSQEFYFRGKMSKNPYTSSQLGKTMSDVRLKICKEMELAEPELVELLVAGKIIAMELSITQVYEQVHWPAMCRQRNPDIYEIPKIEDTPKQNLQPMTVTYRLMGIDGEANEDRIETLSDGSEADSDPANLQKRYGITQAICSEFESKSHIGTSTNGVQVLLDVLESFGPLQRSRYLAEWLFKMIGLALKLKSNRVEFMKYKHAVDHLAKRLFESVGMQSQIEGQKGMTLFDVILVILEQIIGEVTILEDPNLVSEVERMEIDHENAEAATHVQIFIQILTDSCEEMLSNHHALDKTSKKIRAVSKILPFLINKEDMSAHQIIISFIAESLTKIPLLDQLSQMTSKEKFIAQFNIERVIEILESTPVTKNFFKDQISENCGQLLESIWSYLLSTTLFDLSSENSVYKHKLANQYSLKLVHSLFKNNPQAQSLLYHQNSALVSKIYELTQTKYKDKLLTILAQDIIDSVTNNNQVNDPILKEHYKNLISQQNDEKKKLAQKKREEIMKQMDLKKKQNQFLKQIGTVSMQEEVGPKCIVCLEGYTKKPTEVLGMYVFSKKLKVSEVSLSGNGFINTQGYTTVTHSILIHFTCHQNAFRADSQLKQPKKEWEGAVIRNQHTKCNNLFPVRGGNLPTDAYAQMVERYFQVQAKSAGQCDPDRVKVMQHDFKLVLKRLAYEDSFSRDTHGGGPEHNMHLVPFMIQMINYLLNFNGGFAHANNSSTDKFSYVQERRISEFLDQGMKLKRDFLQKMEEEKKAGEIEEEEKQMNDDDSSVNDGQEEEDSNFSLDQIAFMLSQCIIFCQLPRWEQYKYKFLSIILCTISGMKDDKADQPKPAGQQTDFATGKRVLTINKEAEDTPMVNADAFRGLSASGTESRSGRRRLSSDNKSELIQKALIRIRPLLVLMRLVDSIKQRWDGKRLGILTDQSMLPKHEDYLRRLVDEFLSRGNLQEVIGECDALFRDYKDKMLKISSVEEFLQEMGMVVGDVEQFILSHF